MAAEFVVYEVSTTQHYAADGALVADAGTRVLADVSRPLPDGWRYDVERVERPAPEPVSVEKDDPAPSAPPASKRSGRSG